MSELVEANEALSAKLARLEHLLPRDSGNSSTPRSKDDDPGKPAPPEKNTGDSVVGATRAGDRQPGAAGSHLPWTETADARLDWFPQGRCECGDDLGAARDLGIVDRYQQHEIPQVSAMVIQYDQHQVECGCRRAAHRGAARGRPGRSGTARPWPCRGVADGGACHPRAPGRRAAGSR